MTLTIVVTIVLTLVPLTLAPIILMQALGAWSETPCLLIYRISVLRIIALIIRRWWFSQVVNNFYLFYTPCDMF